MAPLGRDSGALLLQRRLGLVAAGGTQRLSLGVCIHADPDADTDPERYALLPSIQAPWQWAWSRFRRIDHPEDVMAIIDAFEHIFTGDAVIHSVTSHHGHPF